MNARGLRFGLLGDPVDHSLSPRMHAAGFSALGIEAEYVLERVPARESDADGSLDAAMRRFAATGGGNVTIPHKGRAALALDEATAMVRATGACNCFWASDQGRLVGDNTDVSGIAAALTDLVEGRTPRDVLIVGAGGAAAAAAVAARDLGALDVRLANRTPSRAARVVAHLRAFGVPARTEAWPPAGTCVVIVNATSLGLREADPLPASFDRVTARAALDLVYRRRGTDEDRPERGTPWTRAAAGRGIPATDGLEVLLLQGAACYPRWFGRDAPLDALRRALVGEAEE